MDMMTTPPGRSGFAGWSRRGKVLLTLMVSALCVEGAVALQTVAYPVNPCKIDEIGKFVTEAGGCKDVATGRVWSRNSWSPERSGSHYAFNPAVSYCSNLVEGGYDDWRLPTFTELKVVSANGAGTYLDAFWIINEVKTSTMQYDMPKWSSTTYTAKNINYAYTVAIGSGTVYTGYLTAPSKTGNVSSADVICVR